MLRGARALSHSQGRARVPPGDVDDGGALLYGVRLLALTHHQHARLKPLRSRPFVRRLLSLFFPRARVERDARGATAARDRATGAIAARARVEPSHDLRQDSRGVLERLVQKWLQGDTRAPGRRWGAARLLRLLPLSVPLRCRAVRRLVRGEGRGVSG